jgi:hypothetical protein
MQDLGFMPYNYPAGVQVVPLRHKIPSCPRAEVNSVLLVDLLKY